jgi:RNA polymerase sigma-54 factor
MADIKLQQRQTLHLSAQQILGSQLLQLPMLNLEQRIYDELQENPLLELVDERKDTADDVVAEGERSSVDDMFDAVERLVKVLSRSVLKHRFPVNMRKDG